MRSYGQYCSVAKSLDLLGDRWTLLIVRELLLRGPSRYTDIRDGLPGIATNLLADRLRQLEDEGVVTREEAPPPVATTLFRLTPRGEKLRGVLEELGRWGAPLMAEPPGDDAFRGYWLALPAELFLRDRTPNAPPITIGIEAGDERIVLETVDGAVRARSGTPEDSDAVLTGSPHTILGVLMGAITLAEARKRGLKYQGDAKTLQRVQPMGPAAVLEETGAREVAGDGAPAARSA